MMNLGYLAYIVIGSICVLAPIIKYKKSEKENKNYRYTLSFIEFYDFLYYIVVKDNDDIIMSYKCSSIDNLTLICNSDGFHIVPGKINQANCIEFNAIKNIKSIHEKNTHYLEVNGETYEFSINSEFTIEFGKNNKSINLSRN